MQILFNGGLVLLPILYTLLLIGYARLFAGVPVGVARIARPLLASTIGAHFLLLLLRGIEIGACPLGNRWETISLVALAIALTYFLVETNIRHQSSGVFFVGLALLLQFAASVCLLSIDELPPAKLGALRSVHALASTVGYSAVAVSSMYGLLYLLLYQAIKGGQYGLFFQRIPDLETLSHQNYLAAVTACVALTVSVGALALSYFAPDGAPPAPGAALYRGFEIEHALTLGTWLLFTAALIARRLLLLGGKRLAYSTLLGLPLAALFFVVLVLNGGTLG